MDKAHLHWQTRIWWPIQGYWCRLQGTRKAEDGLWYGSAHSLDYYCQVRCDLNGQRRGLWKCTLVVTKARNVVEVLLPIKIIEPHLSYCIFPFSQAHPGWSWHTFGVFRLGDFVVLNLSSRWLVQFLRTVERLRILLFMTSRVLAVLHLPCTTLTRLVCCTEPSRM